MFSPHLASIRVDRAEPSKNFDAEKSHLEVARRFDALAQKIVLRDNLKKRVDPKRSKKAHEKIKKMVETDERMKFTKNFLKTWNHWREFYFQLPAIEVKTSGQVTLIENAIDFAKEKEMDLNILIACVHRAYQKRKFKPSFQEIITRGEEHYQLYDDVIADIEKSEWESKSMDRY